MSVVLMYHAIFPDNDTSTIDDEDLPYAVSVSDFTAQLDLLVKYKVGIFADSAMPELVISFDDGHVSNLLLAAPLLLERNLPAYFFVTSNFVGKRKHFMSSDELSELSRISGMCIGSHGMTHRFFDDMSRDEAMEELGDSRRMLESLCGSACRSISFPGGRYNASTLELLGEAGYTQWFGSEIGLVDSSRLQKNAFTGTADDQHSSANSGEKPLLADKWSLSQQHKLLPLQRVAIKRNTQMEEFSRIIRQEPAYFRRKRLSSQVKHTVRRIIGNRLYHGLYKSLAAR